ncbi:MAG TPA: MogA/MoaB family molybdenum cofactor biosynthesis protein [Candidatus Polarisedimenticolia bacterium]|jgi:molybdenum cofactor biosynthesis protein B|nr:MogA/MoaB family molybdenum cofactor biosynthesis protein [Candidatus Polarisedimenticolia bacterium]
MSRHEHRRQAPAQILVGVLTISDTRTAATDSSGRAIRKRLSRSGHVIADYRIVPDEPVAIRKTLREWGKNPRIEAMILTGGTGVSPRDGTYEVIEKLLSKRLDGFGEIFRLLSFRQVGAAAFLSRAVAGVCAGKPLFSLPGSERAVVLAMDRLILPELGHLIQQLRK